MAYGVVHHFAGGTKEQFDATAAAVRSGDMGGEVFFATGPSAGGWTVVAIYDSKENWERFRDGVLMPRMAQGIEGGFTAPPQELAAFEVHLQVPA